MPKIPTPDERAAAREVYLAFVEGARLAGYDWHTDLTDSIAAILARHRDERIAELENSGPAWAQSLLATVKRLFPSECIDPSSVIEAAAHERDSLRAEVERLREVVGFFQSAAASGEPVYATHCSECRLAFRKLRSLRLEPEEPSDAEA